MGQVWSKANFDGTDKLKHLGGHGSVLAVTGQGPNLLTPLNKLPVDVSIDHPDDPGCGDSKDRVRGFTSLHVDGAFFLMADGAVRFVSNSINRTMYRSMSTISGTEVIEDF